MAYNSNFIVMIIEIDDNREGKYEQMLALGIKKMIKDIINDVYQGEVVDEYFNKIIAIVNYDEYILEDILTDSIENIGKRIEHDIKKYFDKTVTIGIGNPYRKADNIMTSYHEAHEALEYKLFLGTGELIFYNDVAVTSNRLCLSYPFSQEEKIHTALNLGDTENISEYVTNYLGFYTQKNNISPDYIKRVCLHLIYMVLRKLSEWEISLDSLGYQEEEISDEIRSFNSYQNLENYMVSFFKAIANYEKDEQNKYNYSTIKKACDFIKENYDKDLSLRTISNSVHLTRTYFANLFKEKTGKTVMAYLKDIRIENAEELLRETDYKIYEIAEKVGYNNPNYFAKVFKEYNGLSPNEYRNSSL